jgi:hypothetical protein
MTALRQPVFFLVQWMAVVQDQQVEKDEEEGLGGRRGWWFFLHSSFSLLLWCWPLNFKVCGNDGRPVGSMLVLHTVLSERSTTATAKVRVPASKSYDYRNSKSKSLGNYSDSNNQILHDGFVGLGHRLSCMASAYHFAYVLVAAQIRFEWEQECENSGTPLNLFGLRFGPELIMVNHRHRLRSSYYQNNTTRRCAFE